MQLPKISAHAWRKVHAALTGVWALGAIPTVLVWSESILWISLVSVYANVGSHFSAYQAARAEGHKPSIVGHAIATAVWALLIIPTVLVWRDSVLYLALISVYANAATHFSAYQGSRAEEEVNGDEDR